MRVRTRRGRPRWLALLLLAGVVGCTNTPPDSPKEGEVIPVSLKHVTFTGYQDTLKQLKGKVVLVDFWQTT